MGTWTIVHCLGALSPLTFSLNPFVLDAVALPVPRLVVLRVGLCVRQVDDEAESRYRVCDVLGCVSERAERKKRLKRWKNVDYCSHIYLSGLGRRSQMFWGKG